MFLHEVLVIDPTIACHQLEIDLQSTLFDRAQEEWHQTEGQR